MHVCVCVCVGGCAAACTEALYLYLYTLYLYLLTEVYWIKNVNNKISLLACFISGMRREATESGGLQGGRGA